MSILITGGAGYIGSHMVYAALEAGEQVVVVDDLSTGRRGLVARDAIFVQGNVGDITLVRETINRYAVDAIIHFAGSVVVPDSIRDPLYYYYNNTVVARNLIAAAVESRVRHFIFSSSAAVYGSGSSGIVAESCPTTPISPYGRSKLMTEWILEDTAIAHDFNYIALRYFNVAGADPKGRTGQASKGANHLIKRCCDVALNYGTHLDIYGSDYPTPDGTGLRDFIHVSDLVAAHALALRYLREGGNIRIMNCGYGHGTSVRQVIAAVERIAKTKIQIKEAPRRQGDPSSLIADSGLIRKTLGWIPIYDNLDEIIESAYEWNRRLHLECNAGQKSSFSS